MFPSLRGVSDLAQIATIDNCFGLTFPVDASSMLLITTRTSMKIIEYMSLSPDPGTTNTVIGCRIDTVPVFGLLYQ